MRSKMMLAQNPAHTPQSDEVDSDWKVVAGTVWTNSERMAEGKSVDHC